MKFFLLIMSGAPQGDLVSYNYSYHISPVNSRPQTQTQTHKHLLSTYCVLNPMHGTSTALSSRILIATCDRLNGYAP